MLNHSRKFLYDKPDAKQIYAALHVRRIYLPDPANYDEFHPTVIFGYIEVSPRQKEGKREEPLITTFHGEKGDLILGGFDKQSFFIGFSKKSFPKLNCDFFLGDFGVIQVSDKTVGTPEIFGE